MKLVQHLLLSLLLSLVTLTLSAVDPVVWVDPQNAARAAYGLSPFLDDPNLASLAQQHTDKCVYGFPDRTALATAYTQLTGQAAPSFGMNLGSATPGFSRPSWLDQKPNWVCLSNTCTTTDSCGGFTQVIWKDSLRMGCALSSCGTQEISLCLYTPAGNINGQHPFGTETFRCSSETSTPTDVIVPTPTAVTVPTPTAVTVPTPTAVTVPTPAAPVSSSIDFDVFVTPQNAARLSYGLNPFVYDQYLAALAQRHTNKCVSYFPDRTALATDYTALTGQPSPSFGMNVGSATPGYSRPLWLDQKSSWTCISNTCSATSCGGYTQVIWKSSTSMGCAISTCGTIERFLCLYSPAGNIVGQHPFGTETSLCTATGSVASSLSTEVSTSTSFSSSQASTHSARGRGRGRAKAKKF